MNLGLGRETPGGMVVPGRAHPAGMPNALSPDLGHPLRGAIDLARGTGGRRLAATSGYRLGRLRR
ncbi:hypothetical protein ARNL5_00489 [Anaerolineae bacterium]|nr:hypothetical protein ARNL5_00489 [Anaerolineae bacterium]